MQEVGDNLKRFCAIPREVSTLPSLVVRSLVKVEMYMFVKMKQCRGDWKN